MEPGTVFVIIALVVIVGLVLASLFFKASAWVFKILGNITKFSAKGLLIVVGIVVLMTILGNLVGALA